MAGKKGMKMNSNNENSQRCIEYWKKNNPNWTLEQCEEKVKWFKKSCNYKCIEYYERNYPELSHEEHLKLKEKLYIQQKQNRKTNIEYWIKRYPEKSLEELEVLRSNAAKENNKCNIEYWIKKYPEKTLEELKELHHNHYQSWLSHQEGWGKGEKNFNHRNNSTPEERKSRSPKNIEFYKKRYPNLSEEEQHTLLNEQFNKTKTTLKTNHLYNTQLEYYLNKGYSYEESYLKLKERQSSFSLKKCIEKYGEEIGHIKFFERQKKWLNKLYSNFQINGDGRSYQSKFANDLIKNICKYFDIDKPKKEYYIYDKENKRAYAYDFSYNHHIIEFNGDYWHCNPIIYKGDFFNKVKQKTANEIWEYDLQKKKCAEKYNNKYLIIWEYEYNNDREKTFQKCIDFIKE